MRSLVRVVHSRHLGVTSETVLFRAKQERTGLLPQPHGFEGLGAGRVLAATRDLSITNRKTTPHVCFVSMPLSSARPLNRSTPPTASLHFDQAELLGQLGLCRRPNARSCPARGARAG